MHWSWINPGSEVYALTFYTVRCTLPPPGHTSTAPRAGKKRRRGRCFPFGWTFESWRRVRNRPSVMSRRGAEASSRGARTMSADCTLLGDLRSKGQDRTSSSGPWLEPDYGKSFGTPLRPPARSDVEGGGQGCSSRVGIAPLAGSTGLSWAAYSASNPPRLGGIEKGRPGPPNRP